MPAPRQADASLQKPTRMTRADAGVARLALGIARREPVGFWLLGMLVLRAALAIVIMLTGQTQIWLAPANIVNLVLLACFIVWLAHTSAAPSGSPHPRWIVTIGAILAYFIIDSYWPMAASAIVSLMMLTIVPAYSAFFLLAAAGKLLVLPLLLAAIWAAAGTRQPTLHEFFRMMWTETGRWLPAFLALAMPSMALAVYFSYRHDGQELTRGMFLLMQLGDGIFRFAYTVVAAAIFVALCREARDRRAIFE